MNLEIIEPINSKSLILAYLGGITGAILVYIFSNFFQKENIFVKTIAQNTLFIMFFHTIFLFLTKTFNIDSSIINLPFQSLIFIFSPDFYEVSNTHLLKQYQEMCCLSVASSHFWG